MQILFYGFKVWDLDSNVSLKGHKSSLEKVTKLNNFKHTEIPPYIVPRTYSDISGVLFATV